MKERYITLDVPNTSMRVVVKLDDDGVVVDIASRNDDEALATTWKTYGELGVEVNSSAYRDGYRDGYQTAKHYSREIG